MMLRTCVFLSLLWQCGSERETPSRCFDKKDPSTCLHAGSHVVFMGDSVTRYQYISLVMALRYGGVPLDAHPNNYTDESHCPVLDNT
eukprot:2608939-Rhodomonas_salina.1